jgi:hypothetical protein
MISSVVSDLDITSLTLAPADPLLGNRLTETVFRFRQGWELAPRPLSAAVQAAAQRLVRLVVGLRSQDSGWPPDLPQTPENLEPYISEEVEELLEALGQSPALKAAPEPNQPQLLLALTPPLLWAIASSGYEVMRLLEGVQARVQHPDESVAVGILRLVPLLCWQTEAGDLAVDLATHRRPQEPLLPADVLLQLTEGDLEGSQRPVASWLLEIGQQVGQHRRVLRGLLGAGCPVEALSPGHGWWAGQLRLSFALTLEEAAWTQPPTTAFTLDDFAETLGAADLPPTVEGDPAWGAPLLALPPEAAQGQRVCLPKPGFSACEETLAAWLTLTDETWIQRFLLAAAGDCFCQALALPSADRTLPTAVDLVQGVYAATGAVQGADGLFKQTFVHQPMLLADLWPRLRWFWMGTHPLVMQLMGGMPVQWLSPGAAWQSGTLYLQPAATLPLDSQSRWLNLATGQLLPGPPAPVSAHTLLLLPSAELGHQPLPMAALMAWVEDQLAQRSQTLTACSDPIAVDLHWLDGLQSVQADLALSWQFTLQAGG